MPSILGISTSVMMTSGLSVSMSLEREDRIGGDRHDLDAGIRLEHLLQCLPDHGRVVDDHHPDPTCHPPPSSDPS